MQRQKVSAAELDRQAVLAYRLAVAERVLGALVMAPTAPVYLFRVGAQAAFERPGGINFDKWFSERPLVGSYRPAQVASPVLLRAQVMIDMGRAGL